MAFRGKIITQGIQLLLHEDIVHIEFNLPAFDPPSLDERKRMATILKSARLTLTTSRINVLYHLTRTVIPSTALELSRLLNVPLSTTHRNLSVLSKAGLADYIIDRTGVSRWFLVSANYANFCPCCNQEYTRASQALANHKIQW